MLSVVAWACGQVDDEKDVELEQDREGDEDGVDDEGDGPEGAGEHESGIGFFKGLVLKLPRNIRTNGYSFLFLTVLL